MLHSYVMSIRVYFWLSFFAGKINTHSLWKIAQREKGKMPFAAAIASTVREGKMARGTLLLFSLSAASKPSSTYKSRSHSPFPKSERRGGSLYNFFFTLSPTFSYIYMFHNNTRKGNKSLPLIYIYILYF